MNIALLSEGTYPQSHGGVSVWCDQLITGLPEYNFQVFAITGSSQEKPVWTLPANISRVVTVPLWDVRTARRNRHDKRLFKDAYAQFLHTLFALHTDAVEDFSDALRGLHRYALAADLTEAMQSQAAVQMLFDIWSESGAEDVQQRRRGTLLIKPTVHDALQASMWLAHLLRPLTVQAPHADVTHAVSNGLPALIALAGKWANGTPFILTEHGVYLRERYLAMIGSGYFSNGLKSLLLRFYDLLTSAAYRVADLITPGSQYNQRWEVHQGADPNRVRPVYNGINPAIFAPTRDDQEPLVPTISWLGRVDPLKDLETLIRAFHLVRGEMPQAKLRMFGATPAGNEAYARHCQDLIGSLNITDAAVFEGRVGQVKTAYQAGHVVALTSISEGFPYTVIEAMATGRPTVCTDVGGVGEAVGNAGLVVPPRDHEAFARACLQLLTDKAMRVEMGREARMRVLSQFTLNSFLDVYRQLYPFASGATLLTHPLQLPGVVGPA